MNIPWQLQTPISAVIFDCDGTLSAIEGIDELAKNSQSYDIVRKLTEEAMEKSSINADIYQKRLALTQPTLSQVLSLGELYIKQQAPDVLAVITLLKRLKKTVYIVSGGLFPAVAYFGNTLGVPNENIFAVKIYFDKTEHYQDFDKTSPLIQPLGKQEIVSTLKTLHPTLVYIGDGMSDIVVKDLVTRFIGYGGAFYREKMKSLCPFYLTTASMAPVLPLILTKHEKDQLTHDEQTLYQQGFNNLTLPP